MIKKIVMKILFALMALWGIMFLMTAISSIWAPSMEELEEMGYEIQSEMVITGGDLDLIDPIDEDAIEDSKYADSIEGAMNIVKESKSEDEKYMCNLDDVIFQMESDNYAIVFYRSVKDDKYDCYTMAKFKKKIIDGDVKYACLTRAYGGESKIDGLLIGDLESLIRDNLALADYARDMSVYPGETRFLYGMTAFDDIYGLKIEGQAPTGIIERKYGKRTWYFWYYEDLQSDKPGSQLEFTID